MFLLLRNFNFGIFIVSEELNCHGAHNQNAPLNLTTGIVVIY